MLFSIFFDRVAQELTTHLAEDCTRHPYDTFCRYLTLQLVILLFADDVALLAKDLEGLRRLFRRFQSFCDTNHLRISETKTEIMPINVPDPPPTYRFEDFTFKTVSSFKYLGLHLNTDASPNFMIQHVLGRAHGAFRHLCEFIGTQGWTTVWTNLALYDALVRSNILYGAPVWSPKSLLGDWGTSSATLRPLEVFHRRCLQTILGLPLETRNAILYITANKPPVTILIAKAAWRYFRRLNMMTSSQDLPPVGVMNRWIQSQATTEYTINHGLLVFG